MIINLWYDRAMEAMMKMIPIQVTDEGVFIPRIYLRETDNFELIIEDEYILVRPQATAPLENLDKPTATEPVLPKPAQRFAFIGIGQTRNPKASVEAEEILQHEVDQREGWSLDE